MVAVKAHCDGCVGFYAGDVTALASFDLDLFIATSTPPGEYDFVGAREVHYDPDLLTSLDVRWPPFYVLLVPAPWRVVQEGLAFGPEQVAQEITSHLN